MEKYLPLNLLDTLGLTLLHSVWELTLIGLTLYLVLIGLGKSSARLRYGVSVLAMALMAVAPILTFAILYSPEIPSNPALVAATWLAQASSPMAPDLTVPETAGFFETLLLEYRSFSPWIVAIWMLGAVFLAIRLAGGYWYSHQLRRKGISEVPESMTAMVAALQRKMGMLHPVKLLASARVTVPMALGHFKPVILLPVSMLTGLSDTQLECIFIHELAHIRRYDYLINILQRLVEIALFFHPAVWIVSKYLREERENACDEVVVNLTENKMEYVKTLLHLENLRSKPGLALLATGGSLFSRIKLIMEKQNQKPNYGHGALFLVLFGVAIVLFLWSGNRCEKEDDTETVAMASLNGNPSQNDVVMLNHLGADWVVTQDSPVKKVTIVTREGEKIQGTLDADGNLESLKVNGQEVDNAEYDRYAARINQAVKGNDYVAVEDVGDGMSDEDKERLAHDMDKLARDMEKLGQGFEGMGQGMQGFESMMEGLGQMLSKTLGASMDGDFSPEDEAEIEAWSKDFEAKMEVWGEQFGKDMEKWGEKFERDMEKDQNWDEFGAKWEKWGEEFEAKMEARADRMERLKEEGREEEYEAEMKAMEQELAEGLGQNMGDMMAELGEKLSSQLAGLGELGNILGGSNPASDPNLSDKERARIKAEMERAKAEMARAQAELARAQAKISSENSTASKSRKLTQTLKSELVRDRLIEKGDGYNLKINQKHIWVNGKKLSDAHYTKYLDIINENSIIDLKKANKFELEFED
ncbi:MAG: hypothetical protein H6581_20380 [Bacteroidia bacterium]|nr:hypothetical protein [Bacteroidia bacterium]